MHLRYHLTLFLFITLGSLFATTYYIDASGGSNANDGLSPATAWEDLANIRNVAQQGGDRFLFKRGGRWDGAMLYVTSSGTANAPITYGAYGTGARPIISVTGDLPGTSDPANWQPGPNGSWYISQNRSPGRLFLDGVEVLRSNTLATLNVADNVGATGVWYYDSNTKRLYLVSGANPASTFSSVAGSILPDALQIFLAENLVFTDLDLRGGFLGAIRFLGGNNIRVANCNIGLNARNGVALVGDTMRTCRNITIEDNFIYSGFDFFYGEGSDRGVGDGVLLITGVTNTTIRNNTIQDWTHNGVELLGNCGVCEGVNGNRVMGNTISAANVPYGHPLGADGLLDKCRDNEMAYNVATDCRTSTQLNGNHNWYHHNTFARQRNSPTNLNQGTSAGIVLAIYGLGLVCENNRYEHNVVHDLDESGFLIRNYGLPGTIQGNVIRNNILSATGRAPFNNDYPTGTGIHLYPSSGVGVNTIQHNLYFDPAGSGVAVYDHDAATAFTSDEFNASDGAGGAYTDNLTGDPAFVSAANTNFRLTRNSTAINRGQLIPDLTIDLDGNPIPVGEGTDIGAFEFQCSSPKLDCGGFPWDGGR
ncbi:right-handed parallel beta-helix repeat-containing protein [Lewinella sp. W8]|uniref:right-handed parallel beta-helix repeat-containing protein n=1 Tax=Lewinella sp. W8 TaxID=2528208 RepID=UPI00106881FE|nr:right-handed parallel beta-helix repeat-containing protein [Lewinella sp. W8]MTB52054.1 hypothetical protein [Lewinella sp. W8]